MNHRAIEAMFIIETCGAQVYHLSKPTLHNLVESYIHINDHGVDKNKKIATSTICEQLLSHSWNT